MTILTVVGLVFLLISLTTARLPDGRLHGNMAPSPMPPKMVARSGPVTSPNGMLLPALDTIYYFNQLIDHTDPGLGTFSQRYWFSSQYYQPGGPIVIFTPGEGNTEDFIGCLGNDSIMGAIAQQQNGATLLIEHRCYGLSNPYPDLSVKSLRVHTIQQAIDDLVYFAKTANLPMSGGDRVRPSEAPWILVGGSYSGALTSFVVAKHPDVFYAAYASSAVVESIVDYWQYFDPIRVFMPQNCSNDVQAVIKHIDLTLTYGSPAAKQAIMAPFNMNLSHLDDFAGALRNNLWDWQSLQPDSGPDQQFFKFCDALEVKDGVSAPAEGWGYDHALQAWGSYWSNTYYSLLCGDYDAEDCPGTYDASQSYYTDITVNNTARSWQWTVCNYMGFFQDGAPPNVPTIVSRLIQPIYNERQCTYFFPEAFNNTFPPTPNTFLTNREYHGWNVNASRLLFANGARDPWRGATVSANGTTSRSTSWMPITDGNGFHLSDLRMSNGRVDKTVAAQQTQALAYMKTWLADWKPSGR